MTEETSKEAAADTQVKAEAEEKKESTSAETKNTEHMIPKSRLDEEIAKKEKAEKELLKLQKADEDRKKLEMTEAERAKAEKVEAEKRAEKAEKDLADERARNKVLAEAGKAQFGEKKQKFFNPEIAYKLLTDEEKAGNVLEALTKLAKEQPLLLEQSAANGDGVGTGKKGTKSTEAVAAKYPRTRY